MAFTVRLNGNNYISDKRKTAFTEALEDSQKVHLGGNGQKPPSSNPQPTSAHTQSSSAAVPVVQEQPVRDYSRIFDTLELGLQQSYGHQSETLRVHQQYLHNQAEYANIFSQLMQQQSALFSNGNTTPEKSEITLAVLQSIARSIEQFHNHQTETLSVHNQFLNQQSAYSQAFVQLLRTQYSNSNGGNGGGHEYKPVHSAPNANVSFAPRQEPVLPVPEPEPQRGSPQFTLPATVAEPAPSATDDEPLDSAFITQLLMSIVSEKTGYPVEMLELDMDMEADLGIDSIKRVEIMGALQDQVPDFPDIDTDALSELRTLSQIVNYIQQNDTEAASTEVIPAPELPISSAVSKTTTIPVSIDHQDSVEMKTALLDIVSDKTGYPADMLELGMDMEADLGIDSIKRVEILGALQDVFPSMPEIAVDSLNELRTLQQIIDYIDSQESAEKKV